MFFKKYAFLMVVVSLLMIAFASRCYSDYRLGYYGVPCKAVIINEEIIHSWHNNRPGFVYRYLFDGDYREGHFSKAKFNCSVNVGDTIDIIVDPFNPYSSIPKKDN